MDRNPDFLLSTFQFSTIPAGLPLKMRSLGYNSYRPCCVAVNGDPHESR